MLWLFWVIAALVAIFVSSNVRYAVRRYWANNERAVFTLYLGFLILFGGLVMHLTTHVLAFTQDARQSDLVNIGNN